MSDEGRVPTSGRQAGTTLFSTKVEDSVAGELYLMILIQTENTHITRAYDLYTSPITLVYTFPFGMTPSTKAARF